MIQKLYIWLFLFIVMFLMGMAAIVPTIYAHVVVKPDTAGLSKYQTFIVNVPNEKNIPVTSLRLEIPEGLESVTPNVKPSWVIETKTKEILNPNSITEDNHEHSEEASIIEVSWTGGMIPPGQRDEFLFSAKTPSTLTKLVWKAYQTYADGSVVSWNLSPKSEEKENSGPFSETQIIDDLKPETAASVSPNNSNRNLNILVIIAIALATLSLSLQLRRK